VALRLFVCRTDQVPPGEMRAFPVEGVDVPVLVINIDGTFHATTSMCPHEDVSLADGYREGCKIVCPGHAYEFDFTTGACSHDRELVLRRYPITIVKGELFVDLVDGR